MKGRKEGRMDERKEGRMDERKEGRREERKLEKAQQLEGSYYCFWHIFQPPRN